MKKGKGKKTRKVNKSSVTGKFVSNEEVKRNPATTVRQTVKVSKLRK